MVLFYTIKHTVLIYTVKHTVLLRYGYMCHTVQQSVCHGLVCSTLNFLTVIVKCVLGEVHLGYVMTSCVLLCTCILLVITSGGLMFLLFCRTVIGDADGHFLNLLQEEPIDNNSQGLYRTTPVFQRYEI